MAGKKRILLLMTDQQRFDTIAAAGDRAIRTPNLDRLAARGTLFTHAISPEPLCGPARHTVFSGVKCAPEDFSRNRAHWRHDGRFFTELLAEAGIRTGGFGKFHFHPQRSHPGFLHYAVHEEFDAGIRREDVDYLVYLRERGLGHIPYTCGVKGLLYFQPQRSIIPEEHHPTKWVADRALGFLDAFHDDPFFLFVSWEQPHFPVSVPDRLADLYLNDAVGRPVYDEGETLPWMVNLQRNASDMFDDGRPPALDRVLRSKALYRSSVTFIDEQIGRILDRLEGHGILDETLIVFVSDHGELCGDHRSFGKVCGYEPSVRIPFIVSAPGGERGVLDDSFVTLYDVVPTILGHAGVRPDPSSRLQGASILADRRTIRDRDRAFFGIGDGSGHASFVGVRTRRWKYNRYFAGGLRQLFDLEADPGELRNLLLGPVSPEIRRTAESLNRDLVEWNRVHGYASRMDGEDFRTNPPGPDWKDRNAQYEYWTDTLPAEERRAVWSDARAVAEAIRNEPLLDPADLDLEYWEAHRYPGAIAELERLTSRTFRPRTPR